MVNSPGQATAKAATNARSPRPPVALYIHFPFCLSVCPYCDFVVYGGRAARGPTNGIDHFVEALVAEIGLRGAETAGRFGDLEPLATIYLGGGTPSLMSARQVDRVLEAVDAAFGIQREAEVTIEANPGPTERGDLAGFRVAGVNRLSIGAQSFDVAELKTLGRRHAPADVVDTFSEARRAGFLNVSLDLLYDVAGQSLNSWRSSLAAAIRLEPDHLSAYALTLDDPGVEALTGPRGDHLPTRAGAMAWRNRARAGQDEDRAAASYELVDELLAAAGLRWYELSNWSRLGLEARHNMAYWRSDAWEAVGPGAHAFDGARTRRWNSARLDGYVAALAPANGSDVRLPPGASEATDERTAAADQAILRLRTREGLGTDAPGMTGFRAAISWAWANQLVEPADVDGVRLTSRGRLLADELFIRLLPEIEAAVA